MFEGIIKFFKKFSKNDDLETGSKDTAKERLHLVLMQDRANVSADFLDMMKQEIIDVIKKYIEVDEKEIDVKLTNKTNEDGSIGAPALYANIPISKIKNENKDKMNKDSSETEKVKEDKKINEPKNEKIINAKDEEKIKNIKNDNKNDEKIKDTENNQNDGKNIKEEKLNENNRTKNKENEDKKSNNLEKNEEENKIDKKVTSNNKESKK